MRLILPGGSGHVGAALKRHFLARGDEVVILSRSGDGVRWDGRTLGPWVQELEGADVVINLAGRSVNCRYNEENLRQMMDSRVESTRVVGEAIATLKNPPRVWLQSSTATIYSHRYDASNDEFTGIIGGKEKDVPALWGRSIDIAKAWENELDAANVPNTRKVAMRSAITLSNDPGSIFMILRRLFDLGLGGTIGNGRQYMSWVHELDFCRAVDFLIAREDLSGPINIAAPNPLPQAEFAKILRQAMNMKIGLPAPEWLLKIAVRVMQTESELVLKSRRVVPGILLKEGFTFTYPTWPEAARALVGTPKREWKWE